MVIVKLNYANRKITGEKLSVIVRKDLLRRIDTKSHHAKDGLTDLSLSGKQIGTNLSLISDALVQGIQAGAIKLSEVHLDANDITIRELSRLCSVVKASAPDLKILDLRNNKISVSTSEELGIWLEFLSMLSRCRELQVLNLSKNPLGDRAIEMLAMNFCREGAYRSSEPFSHKELPFAFGFSAISEKAVADIQLTGTPELDDDLSDQENFPRTESSQSLSSNVRVSHSDAFESPERSPHASVGGLRGLKCLSLEETDLSDAGALNLSYMIEHFAHRDDLVGMEQLPERTKYCARLFSIEQPELLAISTNGVKHGGNDFSGAASKMLDLAERSRECASDYGSMTSASSPPRRRSSIAAGFRSPSRRRSSVSSESICGSSAVMPYATELERARTKIQSMIAKEQAMTARRVELWTVSLSMLKISRIVCSSDAKANLGGLDTAIWERIVVQACDVHNLMSATQIANTFRWARDVECIKTEQEWDSKSQHVKTWRTLQAIGCLSYEYVP